MLRVLFTGLMLCLLTGCSLFPEQIQSSQPTRRVTANKLRLLQPGQWYRVRLHDVKSGSHVSRTEYVGRLQKADDDSLTLAEVSMHGRNESTSVLRKVPYLSRLVKNTGVGGQEEPAPKTLSRDQIQQIEPLSAAEATELKKPFERIGVDFDFSTSTTTVSSSGPSPAK